MAIKHPKRFRVLTYILMVCVILLIITYPFHLATIAVSGTSMEPTYSNHEIVLCSKRWDDIKVGDVLVVQTEDDGVLIKRVAFFSRLKKDIFLLSENWEGADSEDFGLIPEHRVIGKILYPVRLPSEVMQKIVHSRQEHRVTASQDDSLHNTNQ